MSFTLAGSLEAPALAVRLLRLSAPLHDDVRSAAACRALERALSLEVGKFQNTAFFGQGKVLEDGEQGGGDGGDGGGALQAYPFQVNCQLCDVMSLKPLVRGTGASQGESLVPPYTRGSVALIQRCSINY